MSLVRFKPARTNLSAFEVRNALPEGTATIAIGAPLQRNSSNTDQLEEHAGTSTVTGIVGVSGVIVTAGTPVFRSDMLYYVATKDIEFVGQVYDVSASAVATVSTTPGTYEGNTYGFVKISGNWYVDEEDTSNVVLTVTKEMPQMNAVLFKFIESAVSD